MPKLPKGDMHYCKTPGTGTDGQIHNCGCGRQYRYQGPRGTMRGGGWLLIKDAGPKK